MRNLTEVRSLLDELECQSADALNVTDTFRSRNVSKNVFEHIGHHFPNRNVLKRIRTRGRVEV